MWWSLPFRGESKVLTVESMLQESLILELVKAYCGSAQALAAEREASRRRNGKPIYTSKSVRGSLAAALQEQRGPLLFPSS